MDERLQFPVGTKIRATDDPFDVFGDDIYEVVNNEEYGIGVMVNGIWWRGNSAQWEIVAPAPAENEWSPWNVHSGQSTIEWNTENLEIEVYWVDYSQEYLPEGRGETFRFSSEVSSEFKANWNYASREKRIVAYRTRPTHQPLTIEVGKSYVTMSGNIRECVAIHGDTFWMKAFSGGAYPYEIKDIKCEVPHR